MLKFPTGGHARSIPLALTVALTGLATVTPPVARAADAPAPPPDARATDLEQRVKELQDTVRQLRDAIRQS